MTQTLPALTLGSAVVRDKDDGRYDLPVVVGRGGDYLLRRHKPHVLKWARVLTRFEEYALAGILRNDETRFMRIIAFTRPVRDGFEFNRRGEWQIIKLPRSVITETTILS